MDDEPIFEFDVFVSHSSKDKRLVRSIAMRLKSAGLKVFFDEWEIAPGDLIGQRIEHGLQASRNLLLCMSPNSVKSDWVKLEHQTFLFRDPTNSRRRFIPLLLEECKVPDILRQFLYLDWRDKSDDGFAKLLAILRPAGYFAQNRNEPELVSRNLKRTLIGHEGDVCDVAATAGGHIVSASSDGMLCLWEAESGERVASAVCSGIIGVAVLSSTRIVTASLDHKLRIWDLPSLRCVAVLIDHISPVTSVAISSTGDILSSSRDRTVRVWDASTGRCKNILKGHTSSVNLVVATSDGRAVSIADERSLIVWDLASGSRLTTLDGHSSSATFITLTPTGQAVSSSRDHTLRVWDLDSGRTLMVLEGHTSSVNHVAVIDATRVVSSSADCSLRVWDLTTGHCFTVLEGHTDSVSYVSLTDDGRAISCSWDGTLRLWDLDSGQCLEIFEGHQSFVNKVQVLDGGVAVSASHDWKLKLWTIPPKGEGIAKNSPTRYTNAKVVLVGDTGVGKTSLALRLVHNRFEPTKSSDGAWATHLPIPHATSTEDVQREIWLWDFAGQADYRLIHQMYLDDAALAILVFNPQCDDPFEVLSQWDSAISQATRTMRRIPTKLLVAGRCNRGGLTISRAAITEFCKEHSFASYIDTSAETGLGCRELRDAIIAGVNWSELPLICTTRLFKTLKEAIVQLKDQGIPLIRLSELRQHLQFKVEGVIFSEQELRTVVGLVAGQGIIRRIEFGDFILLQPEQLNLYASALIRSVRAHTDEIGCIQEDRVLDGALDYHDMPRLRREDELILLREMYQMMIARAICLREPTADGTMLVFPSYFKRERPELQGHPNVFVTYSFGGQLDEIYSTLVVRLLHTAPFDKDRLWKNAADFRTHDGRRLGLKMIKKRDGFAEITVYFDSEIADDTMVTFIKYVHEHLRVRAPSVTRVRSYVCPHCDTPFENRAVVEKRLERKQKDVVCPACEQRFELIDLIERKFASTEFLQRVHELEEQSRHSIDNESKELILVGHAFATAGEAGQIFRPAANSDWGIDGEIEFKNYSGEASGKRIYLQLKSGDSYLYER
jgi:WD40 repeat protein/GTPase SAR1 family protein